MAGTAPTRIDDDIAAAAKVVGALLSRSTAQQVNHWARIGRELELSSSASPREVARVLSGQASYDDLDIREQAVVRAAWSERATALREGLDLQAEFLAEGSGWVEVGPDGSVNERSPAPADVPARPARARPRRGPAKAAPATSLPARSRPAKSA